MSLKRKSSVTRGPVHDSGERRNLAHPSVKTIFPAQPHQYGQVLTSQYWLNDKVQVPNLPYVLFRTLALISPHRSAVQFGEAEPQFG
jgi:hypothetical protein